MLLTGSGSQFNTEPKVCADILSEYLSCALRGRVSILSVPHPHPSLEQRGKGRQDSETHSLHSGAERSTALSR